MIEEPQLFGSLAFASHRNGSPIKLPRAQDEVVMLAFDQQNGRLVELHILTGKSAQLASPVQPLAVRRWVKPQRWQPRGKSTLSRLGGRKTKLGRRRQARSPHLQARFLHRFYEPKPLSGPEEIRPEISHEDLQLRVCKLLRAAAGVRGHSFMTILEVGVDDGLPYYVTNLNDGEFVQDYIRRRGALPTVTSLALVHQLLQDLGKTGDHLPLHSTVSLDRMLVSTQEEEYLQLRLFDYGLSQLGATAQGNSCRLVHEACRLLFLLITGQAYPGGNPEDCGVIAELPASLRFVIKSVLTCRSPDLSISAKALRDEIREAMCSYVTLVQARNPKMLLVADTSTLPISHLQTLLLGEIPLKTFFGASFRIQHPELSGCHPFTISAVNISTEQPVTLHLLPPERIVSQSAFMALPPQVWRQDPAKQINLLHMEGLWKGPDWAFLSEAHEPGMSLGALMAKRGMLNPGEVITLLRQIHSGLEQALETGVYRVDLDPSNIQLCLGYDGPVLPRDLERLHQKRLDAWPKFMVKLRLHKTMRSLCKPRLIDLSPWACIPGEASTAIAAREERQRSFICLAAYLLTGEGQMRNISGFPSSMPEAAAKFVIETLQRTLNGGTIPAPLDFIDKLSHLLTAACAEMDRVEDPLAQQDPSSFQEMESAGFVSDFEEDWTPEEPRVDHAGKTLLLAPVSKDLQSLDFHRPSPPRFRFPWLALAATISLLGALVWMIFGDLSDTTSGLLVSASHAEPRGPVPQPEDFAKSTASSAALPPSQPLPQPIIHKAPVPAASPLAEVPPQSPVVIAEASMPDSKEEPLSPTLTQSLASADSPPATVANPPQAEVTKMADSSQGALLAASETAVITEPEPVIRRAILTDSNDAPPANVPTAPKEETASLPSRVTPTEAPPAPEPAVAAAAPPVTAPAQQADVAPPTAVAQLQEVTVRHAIVLTPEEINETLRAQAKARKRSTKRR